MTDVAYKPKRQGLTYPSPTNEQWRRILRKCKHVQTGYNTACWIWCGRIDPDGYGEAKYNGAKRFVHRIALARKGGCPARRDAEHLCRQRACCNPSHLITLPPKQNAGGRSDDGEAPLQVNRQNILDFVGTGDSLPVPF